jgi:SAM-dependent methyltransferase
MFIKLDHEVIDLLCCPLCKGDLTPVKGKFVCMDCATGFSEKRVMVGDHDETYTDFRIDHPSYCIPETKRRWAEIQQFYIKYSGDLAVQDNLQDYLVEIDSVREIYMQKFRMQGSILDVGGHQGRLRHYLPEARISLYVSVDPFPDVFENLQKQTNLLRAFPDLRKPCNFLAGFAENLPFKKCSFDWVHMRSVVDHFADPYWAFKEAYRVLKPQGRLMIGLSIVELQAGKEDDHAFRFSYDQLMDLLNSTGFGIEKEHWQKPPWTYVIYLSAKAVKSGQ